MTPRRFALRFLLFCLPLILFAAWAESALWSTGETWPVARVLDEQARNPKTIWLRGPQDQSFYAYKWAGLTRSNAQIVAVGSSRVMNFRSEMFPPEAGRFYNSGGMVQNLDDLQAFANALPKNGAPRVVLLGIDLWWLNAARPSTDAFTSGIATDGALDWKAHLTLARKMRRHFKTMRKLKRDGPIRAEELQPRLGWGAREDKRGFRFDGSLERGVKFSPGPFLDRETPPIAQRAQTGGTMFEATNGVSRQRLEMLRRALQTLKRKQVLVLAFAPPIAAETARALEKSAGQSTLWREYQTVLPQLCRAENIVFCDASTPQKLGQDDRTMFDGIHAMDTFHLYVLQSWLQNERARDALPATRERVETLLRAPKTNFWFPDYSAVGSKVKNTAEFDRTPKAAPARLR